MDYSFNLLRQRINVALPNRIASKIDPTLVLAAAALAMGLVTAYLIVNDQWYMAMGLILALPGLILLHNYPLLSLAIWLFITPFLMASESGIYRQVYWLVHRGLPLLMVGIIVISNMTGVRKREVPKLAWFEVAMVAYVIATFFSVFMLNPDPVPMAFKVYDRIVVPMLLYAIIRLLSPDEDDLRRLLPVLLFIALSQAFFGFAYVFARGILPTNWLRSDGERASGSVRAVGVYSTTLLFAGTLLLHSALSDKVRAKKQLLYIVAFAGCAVAVFFSFSRASWLAGIAVIVGLLFLYPKFMTRVAVIALPLVAILAGVLLADQIAYADDRLNSDQSALGRLPVIMASIEMFKAEPIRGFGYGNFDEFDRQFQDRVGELVVPEKDHASHNLFLTVLAEQGIIGLALYLSPVIGLAALSLTRWRLLPAEGFWSRRLLAVFWLTIVAHIIVNNFSNMRIVFGLGIWWIALALIANLLYHAPRSARTERRDAYLGSAL